MYWNSNSSIYLICIPYRIIKKHFIVNILTNVPQNRDANVNYSTIMCFHYYPLVEHIQSTHLVLQSTNQISRHCSCCKKIKKNVLFTGKHSWLQNCKYDSLFFFLPIFLGLGRFRLFMISANSSMVFVRRGLNLRSSPTDEAIRPETQNRWRTVYQPDATPWTCFQSISELEKMELAHNSCPVKT